MESVQVMVMMPGLCASRRRTRYTHRTCQCGYRVLCLHCLLNRESNKNDKKESKTTPISQILLYSHDKRTARVIFKGGKQEDPITRPN